LLWDVSTPESLKSNRAGELTPIWGHPKVAERLAEALKKDTENWTTQETLARKRSLKFSQIQITIKTDTLSQQAKNP
jgi:hypothetical protein